MTKLKITVVSMGLVMMLLPSMLFAFDPAHIIAYPVPFNPKQGVKFITIEYDQSKGAEVYEKMVVEVFDINGDSVRKIEKIGAPTVAAVIWNGRNDRGNLVKPGLYIIKVTVENETLGEYGKKLIRVLIKY
ncbi:MAG: hypothetical protein CVV44_16690 [Spirochaetae bacterium HGW-Spirochaetae-1]|jgi:flagellar hook assembly protein FlgD|nr:MAG: hypothetical protein CVV44_16690 [Spirochaetae bacterium HGW-Spirochaetae-1]